jgi:uncharacterized SAM-binding protein YcdF (DUF218 family)
MDFIYIISKVFTFFLAPAVWIFIILIWRNFAKLRSVKRRLGIVAAIIFIFFSNQAIHASLVKAWQPAPVTLRGRQFEAGIVLGGMVSFDKGNNGYLREDADRFYQACKLYRAGIIKRILVSGGHGCRGTSGRGRLLKERNDCNRCKTRRYYNRNPF